MTEAIEMSHDADGARYLMIRDTKIDGGVRIHVSGIEINGGFWRRLRAACLILFRPRTIRSVNIAIMSNVIYGSVAVDGVGEPNGPPTGNLLTEVAR